MIYDCFTFFNELDLLEIRLHTLDKVVDKFVLVEATKTHQGKPKPLHFLVNRARFEAFNNKIIHIIVDDYPSFFSKLRTPNSWDLERHQRNQIKQGLGNCAPDDVILVSDLDEIPNPAKIIAFKDREGIQVFRQINFYYYLNCVNQEENEEVWYGTVMAHAKDFKKPQELRAVSNKMHAENLKILKDKFYRNIKSITQPIFRKEISIVNEAGWHFSFLGGVDKIVEKLEAFAHTEYNTSELKNKENILRAIENGQDLFGRGMRYKFIPIDNSFPDFIYQHQKVYSHLIHETEVKVTKT